MSGTAIDFSVMTKQISQSMERAMSHLTETVQMDMQLLEKRRLEVMTEMETTQLNDFIRGRNEEATLESINQFEDRWVDKMVEKNGRLSDRDMLEMRREKQVVEQIVQKNNAALEQVKMAQDTLRSPQGAMYDGEYAREVLQKYIETGETPSLDTLGVSSQNPFLRIMPVEPEEFLRKQRRPEELGRTMEEVSTDRGLAFRTTTQYATDEDRAAFILSQMRENPQFAIGVQEKYYNLDSGRLNQLKQDAAAEGMNPVEYYALSFSDRLWRDRVSESVDAVTVRREHAPPTPQRPVPPDPRDLSDRSPQELIFDGISVGRGFDLLPAGRRVNRTLVGVRDVNKNEIVNPGATQGVLAGYVPETNKIYVQAKVSDYEMPVMEGGEQVYEATIEGTGRSPVRGSREEVGRIIAKRETEHNVKYASPKPVTETQGSAEVIFELDASDYSDLLQGIKLPQRAQTQAPAQPQKKSTGINW